MSYCILFWANLPAAGRRVGAAPGPSACRAGRGPAAPAGGAIAAKDGSDDGRRARPTALEAVETLLNERGREAKWGRMYERSLAEQIGRAHV